MADKNIQQFLASQEKEFAKEAKQWAVVNGYADYKVVGEPGEPTFVYHPVLLGETLTQHPKGQSDHEIATVGWVRANAGAGPGQPLPADLVQSVNGQSGPTVTLDAEDVGAIPASERPNFALKSALTVVTTTQDGFMLATDKVKLDALPAASDVVTKSELTGRTYKLSYDMLEGGTAKLESATVAGTLTIRTPSSDANNTEAATTEFVKRAVQESAAPLSHVGAGNDAHMLATHSVHGFMSSTDKTKLDSLNSQTYATTYDLNTLRQTVTNHSLLLNNFPKTGYEGVRERARELQQFLTDYQGTSDEDLVVANDEHGGYMTSTMYAMLNDAYGVFTESANWAKKSEVYTISRVNETFLAKHEARQQYVEKASYASDKEAAEAKWTALDTNYLRPELNGKNGQARTGHVLRSGNDFLEGTLDVNNQKLINVPNPVTALDVANKAYVDSKVAEGGGSASLQGAATGNIDLANTYRITNIPLPQHDKDAVSREWFNHTSQFRNQTILIGRTTGSGDTPTYATSTSGRISGFGGNNRGSAFKQMYTPLQFLELPAGNIWLRIHLWVHDTGIDALRTLYKNTGIYFWFDDPSLPDGFPKNESQGFQFCPGGVLELTYYANAVVNVDFKKLKTTLNSVGFGRYIHATIFTKYVV